MAVAGPSCVQTLKRTFDYVLDSKSNCTANISSCSGNEDNGVNNRSNIDCWRRKSVNGIDDIRGINCSHDSDGAAMFGEIDDDDDASFEVGEITDFSSLDVNLKDAISKIEQTETFANTSNDSSSVDTNDSRNDSSAWEDVSGKSAIKRDLRSKIQSRRMSRGVGELKVSFDPPKMYELSADEKRKVEMRKQRNRDSANKSRQRRKEREDFLVKEVKTLEENNKILEREVKDFKMRKYVLQRLLELHSAKCAKLTSLTAPSGTRIPMPNGVYDSS